MSYLRSYLLRARNGAAAKTEVGQKARNLSARHPVEVLQGCDGPFRGPDLRQWTGRARCKRRPGRGSLCVCRAGGGRWAHAGRRGRRRVGGGRRGAAGASLLFRGDWLFASSMSKSSSLSLASGWPPGARAMGGPVGLARGPSATRRRRPAPGRTGTEDSLRSGQG